MNSSPSTSALRPSVHLCTTLRVSIKRLIDCLANVAFAVIAGQLFSDPASQLYEGEEEAPDNLSDDDDDAKLTHNSKAAIDMATPTLLKKPDEFAAATPMKNNKKKGNQIIEPIDEPQTNAQRLEQLHQQQAEDFVVFPPNIGLSGQVFMSGNFYVCNDAEKESGFVDQIDN